MSSRYSLEGTESCDGRLLKPASRSGGSKHNMLAFKVSLNGKEVCVAGIGERGVLNAIVNHLAGKERNKTWLTVGGLDSGTDKHWAWQDHVNLALGDEIKVQIIESESVDTPKERPFATPEMLEAREQRVREMAEELGL